MRTGSGTVVSVLMPVRNEEASVAGAIRSVLAQTQPDLEVLVIDGASDDATVAAVAGLAADEPRIRLLANPNRTIPHALNIGLQAARGRYVARVDAHAAINDSYLERGVRVLDVDPQVAAIGGRRIGVGSGRTGRAIAAALSSPFGVGNSINHYADRAQDTDHASFGVFRTELVRRLGGWDEQLLVNEDVDLDHRIARAGFRIRYDPEMEIHWQVRRSLRDLGRQYRRYGRGKAGMVRKNGRGAVRLRHLVAPALVVWLAGSTIVAVTGHPWIAVALAAPYATGLLVAAVLTRRKAADQLQLAPLYGAFGVMHLSWGLGFLEGFLLGRKPVAASGRDPRRGRTHAVRADPAGEPVSEVSATADEPVA